MGFFTPAVSNNCKHASNSDCGPERTVTSAADVTNPGFNI